MNGGTALKSAYADVFLSCKPSSFCAAWRAQSPRDWFDARKAVYESELKAPLLALIEEINGDFVHFAPAHIRPAREVYVPHLSGSRFSPDKTRYKKHVSAWCARQGLEKKSGGGFYFHLSGKELVMLRASICRNENNCLPSALTCSNIMRSFDVYQNRRNSAA